MRWLPALILFSLFLVVRSHHSGGGEPRPAAARQEVLRGNGFSLRYPASARVVRDLRDSALWVRGPDIHDSAAGDTGRSVAAYSLRATTYHNPRRLTAEAWVRENALSRSPPGPPVLHKVVVADEPAVLVVHGEGPVGTRTYYFARGTRVVAVEHPEVSARGGPVELLQRDMYDLLLGSFHWE